ncbi:hypothetical protein Val02_06840 [Virgisporangium aliadipatigenens]|uniref:SMI1/KNR4 family protein n=1 Tax=Virgisporangium aliadipatigenens TaxID=741659 RepID=A0A8J4DNP6_9ACTN|nr:SMI1/KNR4 family protein [Virgisporangium aliadipatigenens]GIJ43798.1 hypothetical protein Val02_06840 [Virgisporangium aliadipatigenens]
MRDLQEWAARLRAEVDRALRDVVSTYPFEAGAHEIGPPEPDAPVPLPADLAALLRTVGPVSLPDIGNGYFLQAPYTVDRIAEGEVVVFGSDGGGTLYALGDAVYRIRDASYVDGFYDGPVTVIAPDLDSFLERLLGAVSAFADDGSITDL